MPRPKYAIKGQVNFHNVSDEKLKGYLDLIQSLIFEYKDAEDYEKVNVLNRIWKDLASEDTRRLVDSPEVVVKPVGMLGKVPKMKKSPVKRRI